MGQGPHPMYGGGYYPPPMQPYAPNYPVLMNPPPMPTVTFHEVATKNGQLLNGIAFTVPVWHPPTAHAGLRTTHDAKSTEESEHQRKDDWPGMVWCWSETMQLCGKGLGTSTSNYD